MTLPPFVGAAPPEPLPAVMTGWSVFEPPDDEHAALAKQLENDQRERPVTLDTVFQSADTVA